jgi:hypothetical protein
MRTGNHGITILGAHAVVSSRDPDADRAFVRDVLGLVHADAGDGWLIFALPPSELAFHPSRRNGVHEIYLLCADVSTFVRAMRKRGVPCSRVRVMSWGRLTRMRLPGGGEIGVYEPRHRWPVERRARRATPRGGR